MSKAKILICIGTMGRSTFNRCYESVMLARKAFSQKTDVHIVKNKSPQSAWLNKMRKAAMGWDWCFQIDEDMYLYENALEDLYNFAVRKSKKTKILSASSLLYDLFLEGKVGSLKIWNSDALRKLEFRDVLGSDRDIAKRGEEIGYFTVATNLVLADHDSAPTEKIAYDKYYKHILKLKKFENNKDIKYFLNFLKSKTIKNPRSEIFRSAYNGAIHASKDISNNLDVFKDNHAILKKGSDKAAKKYKISLFKMYDLDKEISQEEKVTIIVSVYNKSKYLNRNIKSILNQNYKNIEVIYIDDKSSDNSLDELKKISDPRVSVYSSNVNYGTYACRNYAIKMSTGKYVTFVDADDEIHRSHISNLLYFLKKYNKKAVLSMYRRYDYTNKDFSEPKICEASILTEKSVFKHIGYYEFVRCGADTEFRERMIRVYGKGSLGISTFCSYIAGYDKNSLTNSSSLGKNTKARQEYSKKFREWHKSGKNIFVEYNTLKRYKLNQSIIVKNFNEKNIKKEL